MTPQAWQEFLDRLVQRAAAEPEVVGLVALGSTSGQGAAPDAFSDHDLFLVVREGAQERFRADLRWIPQAGPVALCYRETAHGLKLLFESGHLLELAVFSPDELRLARVNRYRVLLDRAEVGSRMAEVRAATAALPAPDGAWLAGQLLTALLVGAGRHRRGERVAGQRMVKGVALEHLLALLAQSAVPADPWGRDDLDPSRRCERVFPQAALAIAQALEGPLPACARSLLALAAPLIRARGLAPEAAIRTLAAALDAEG